MAAALQYLTVDTRHDSSNIGAWQTPAEHNILKRTQGHGKHHYNIH